MLQSAFRSRASCFLVHGLAGTSVNPIVGCSQEELGRASASKDRMAAIAAIAIIEGIAKGNTCFCCCGCGPRPIAYRLIRRTFGHWRCRRGEGARNVARVRYG